VTPRERAWVRALIRDRRLDSRAAVVIVAVARDGSISNSEVRALLDVDSVQARGLLQLLVSEGVLERRGERGGAQYVIAGDLGVPARIRHTDAELDEIALALAARGPVANALLRDRTGLSSAEARSVLQRLAGRGDLVRLGERGGSRYVLP